MRRTDLGAKYNTLPNILNPFTSIRLDLGLTVDEVARDLSMHRNSILRTEQGQYDYPPQDLLDYYAINSSSTLAAYETWRTLIRKANYGLLHVARLGHLTEWNIPLDPSHETHPFKFWRQVSGVTALNTIAKAFALHQGILFRYESQSNLCASTPSPIVNALLDSGYSPNVISQLELAFERYKATVRRGLVITPLPVGKAS